MNVEKRPPPFDPGENFRRRGEMLMTAKRYEAAIEQFLQWMAVDPESGWPHSRLGICFSNLKKHDDALYHARKAVELSPESAPYRFNLALVYYRIEDYDQARIELREALRFRPQDVQTRALLGWCDFYTNREKRAIAHANKLLAIEPDNYEGFFLRGASYFDLGLFDKAVIDLDEALRLEPEEGRVHSWVGWCRLHQRRWDEAQYHFESALRLRPQMRRARDGLLETLKARSPLSRWAVGHVRWQERITKSRKTIVQVIYGIVAYGMVWSLLGHLSAVAWLLSILPLLLIAGLTDTFLLPLLDGLVSWHRLGSLAMGRWQRYGSRVLSAMLLGGVGVGIWGLVLWDEVIFGAALVLGYLLVMYVQIWKPLYRHARRKMALYAGVGTLLAVLLAVDLFYLDPERATWAEAILENMIGAMAIWSMPMRRLIDWPNN
ncbi:tetratricopeptide repeat protein [Bremerella cremea]|uniref:tetratricopeptide repeat protein n=1 Tax=Bremerella cremea TaxID=1031537 RepID=UPI0031ED1F60